MLEKAPVMIMMRSWRDGIEVKMKVKMKVKEGGGGKS